MQDATAASAVKYFFGRISRDEAEDSLKAVGVREGLYLLRESVMKPGDYVLSICHQGGYVMIISSDGNKTKFTIPTLIPRPQLKRKTNLAVLHQH